MTSFRLSGWLAAIALLVPALAISTPISVTGTGTVTAATNSQSFNGVGATFTLSFSYEPNSFIQASYPYAMFSDPTAVLFSVDFGGADCNTSTGGVQPCTPGNSAVASSSLYWFDNFGTPAKDLLVFTLWPQNFSGVGKPRWRLDFEAPTGTFSGVPGFPLTLDPAFTNFTLRYCSGVNYSAFGPTDAFGACAPGSEQYTGSGTLTASTSVPEPATLALLSIGLAGIGFARRRKRTN